SKNCGRLIRGRWKALWRLPTSLFRSRRRLEHIRFTQKHIIPSTRKDQERPTRGINYPAAREYVRPPNPEPAAVIPFATLRRWRNHWGVIPTEPTKTKPIPNPKHTP